MFEQLQAKHIPYDLNVLRSNTSVSVSATTTQTDNSNQLKKTEETGKGSVDAHVNVDADIPYLFESERRQPIWTKPAPVTFHNYRSKSKSKHEKKQLSTTAAAAPTTIVIPNVWKEPNLAELKLLEQPTSMFLVRLSVLLKEFEDHHILLQLVRLAERD